MAQAKDRLIPANERVTFEVKVAGKGDPVVFLHGAGGLIWDPFLDALSNSHTVYAPYIPGTGNSTGLENIGGFWDLALAYYDLFDKLGLDAVDLVGHSLGGMIAAELAATDQSRVKRLALLAPAGLWLDSTPIPDIFALLPHELGALAVADPEGPVAKAMAQVPESIDERMEMTIARVQVMQAAAKFLWPIPDKGLKNRLYRVKAPALIVWGKQDHLISPVYADYFHRLIDNSEVVLVDDAGHLLTLEQTAKVLDAVEGFLAGKQAMAVA